jgi:hypothetical protein
MCAPAGGVAYSHRNNREKTVNGKIPGKSFIKEIQKKSNSKFETNNKKV